MVNYNITGFAIYLSPRDGELKDDVELVTGDINLFCDEKNDDIARIENLEHFVYNLTKQYPKFKFRWGVTTTASSKEELIKIIKNHMTHFE